MNHAPASKLEEDVMIATTFLHHIDKIGASSNGNSASEECATTSAWKNYGKSKSVGRF
jgi:hypothetical protein